MSAPPPVPPLVGDFTEVVLLAERPVLVDFWAAWCPPCTQMAPVVAEIAREFHGRADVVAIDTETPSGRALAREWDVSSIPTLLVFSRGREAARLVGARPKADLRRALTNVAPPQAPGVAD